MVLIIDVGVGCPLVKGASDTLDAPLKAAAPAVAEAEGAASLDAGFRTLIQRVSMPQLKE